MINIKNCTIGRIIQTGGGDYYEGVSSSDDCRSKNSRPEPQDVEFEEVKESVKEQQKDVIVKQPSDNGIVVADASIADIILDKLDSLIKGKTNKDAATIVNGALAAGAILKPTYTEFSSRYGNGVMSSKTFYKFVGLDKLAITKEEIEPIRLIFEQLLHKKS